MKNKLFYGILTMAILGGGFFACKKDDIQKQGGANPAFSDATKTPIPYYSSADDLLATLAMLEEKDATYLDAWEKQKGFESMRSVFDKIVDAEAEIGKKYYNLSAEEEEKLKNRPIEHATITRQNQDMLVTSRTEDGAGYYDKNIDVESHSAVVNRFGLMKIGNEIHQRSKDFIKIITDGDLSKINLLRTIVQTDEKRKIIVIPIEGGPAGIAGPYRGPIGPGGPVGGGGKGATVYDVTCNDKGFDDAQVNANLGTGWTKSCTNDNDRFRIIFREEFIQVGGAQEKFTRYQIYLRSLQRRVLGLWYDNHKAYLGMSGSHTGNIAQCKAAVGFTSSVNYTGGYSNSTAKKEHTFPRTLKASLTVGDHPIVYNSTWKGYANDEKYVECSY